MRMVAGVHDDTADGRADAHVAFAASFTDVEVLMLAVANRTDGGFAVDRDHAYFTRGQADLGIGGVFGHQLGAGTGGADHLGAFARLELDVVDHGTDRDGFDGQGIASHDVSLGSAFNHVTDLETFGCQDISLGAVEVLDQGQIGGAVRIILDRNDSGLHAGLVALPVDDADLAAVAATMVADGDAAIGVTATGFASWSQKGFFRRFGGDL